LASGQDSPWHSVTARTVVAAQSTDPVIKLDNADATFTLLSGTGLALNGSNVPTGSTVTAVQRVDAAGNILESVTGDVDQSAAGLIVSLAGDDRFILDLAARTAGVRVEF
jgi:hypothetical protein